MKACYKATPDEIGAHYAEWEIIDPGEERLPAVGYFNPGRPEGE